MQERPNRVELVEWLELQPIEIDLAAFGHSLQLPRVGFGIVRDFAADCAATARLMAELDSQAFASAASSAAARLERAW